MHSLLLLHGAIGAQSQLVPLAALLANSYDVHLLNFSGHGGEAIPAHPFSIESFAEDVIKFMKEKGLAQVSIFGYSMGGYVAMYLAKHHPEKINKIVTLATKYHWDEVIAAKEVQMLDPEKIEIKIPAFANALKERHLLQNWKDVLGKTAEMMKALGQHNTLQIEDYASITAPALLLLGDRDKMVSIDETINVYKSLPAAQMAILPNTAHPIEQADKDLLAYFIKRFIQ
ncbi:MAG: alpha/beta fold hydrolase [Bacteroidetes bacterium]|nr:alpha/beta fold hydrolase [Bacteroidota bacterium]